MEPETLPSNSQSPRLYIILGLSVLSLCLLWLLVLRAPSDFPQKTLVSIEKGETLSSIANKLESLQIVRSAFWFKQLGRLFQVQRSLNAGDYFFDQPISTLQVVGRIVRGEHGLSYIKVTFPEGTSVKEMAVIAKEKLPTFDSTSFLKSASSLEGYLFPDTYLFLSEVKPDEVIKTMQDNFQKRLAPLELEILAFGKPMADVIKMASIIEEEGRTTETRRIIAGILWKRLSLGMPLQVDASFKYINGKTTKTLTTEDLKIDSLYNSYKYKGLPPTPISNPGLDSILATIRPIKTRYFYFLTDDAGNMHYAITFDEHIANKAQFLR